MFERLLDKVAQRVTENLKVETAELAKAETPAIHGWPTEIANFNAHQTPDRPRKPSTSISFSQLRALAIHYPIARACIDYLRAKVLALEWDIHPCDEAEVGTETAEAFFKMPCGERSRFRGLVDVMIEDCLTLDAVALYRERTYGGELLSLLPVDPATIKLRVTETGRTPLPPEFAYEQYIQGKKVEPGLTVDDLIYEIKNPRTNTPYGRAPLESLIMQVTAALNSVKYNAAYLSDGNVPEGFVELPKDVAANATQIAEWQTYFDALVAGDPRMQRRLKAVPGGTNYTPTKTPSDMSFEKFEQWLGQQTCAVFGVPPQDIGFTMDVNRATGEVQQALGVERGLRPLVGFLKEIFDAILHDDLGMTDVEFEWLNVDPTDLAEEVSVADTLIRIGAKSVDEYREEHGEEPIGLGHFIMTMQGPVLVSDLLAPKPEPQPIPEQLAPFASAPSPFSPAEGEPAPDAIQELRRYRKKAVKRFRKGDDPALFASDILPPERLALIAEGLKFATSEDDIRKLFDMMLEREDRFTAAALELHSELTEILEADSESAV